MSAPRTSCSASPPRKGGMNEGHDGFSAPAPAFRAPPPGSVDDAGLAPGPAGGPSGCVPERLRQAPHAGKPIPPGIPGPGYGRQGEAFGGRQGGAVLRGPGLQHHRHGLPAPTLPEPGL